MRLFNRCVWSRFKAPDFPLRKKLQSKCQSHSQGLTDRMVMGYALHNLDRSWLSTLLHPKGTRRVFTSSFQQNLFQLYEQGSSSRLSVSKYRACAQWMQDKSFHLFTYNHQLPLGYTIANTELVRFRKMWLWSEIWKVSKQQSMYTKLKRHMSICLD